MSATGVLVFTRDGTSNMKGRPPMDLEELDLEGKTPEEIIALCKEEGYDLSDAELEQINGGWGGGGTNGNTTCPKCKGKNITKEYYPGPAHIPIYVCGDCGHTW